MKIVKSSGRIILTHHLVPPFALGLELSLFLNLAHCRVGCLEPVDLTLKKYL